MVGTPECLIRVTHVPTGMSVTITDRRGQHKGRDYALTMLNDGGGFRMSDLKPCPFCGAGEATDGNNASFSGVELMAAGTDRPYVWCGTCCASARMADTEAEAIAAWNTRTTDPAAIREAAMEIWKLANSRDPDDPAFVSAILSLIDKKGTKA